MGGFNFYMDPAIERKIRARRNARDMRALENGTKFCILNQDMITADLTGHIFSHNGRKYMHIDQTGESVELTGREKFYIKIFEGGIKDESGSDL